MAARWLGFASGTVSVPVDRVWEIAQFGELHKWDSNVIENCDLEQGDGCSSGSLRRVVFKYPNGSKGSLLERMTYYYPDDYTFAYEMEENPLGYEGYTCTFSLQDHGDRTTTVSYSFEMDAREGSTESAVIPPIEGVCRRRIALLETVAAEAFIDE